nr:hypothetical protein [uncultured Flavobacterium sp.]
MKRSLLLILTILCFLNLKAQDRVSITKLIDKISLIENSRLICPELSTEISKIKRKDLVMLIDFFDDKTVTKVYSDCNERYLSRGEIAIIIGDLRENMPYATLTHIQNCTLTFCENNPNLIEYYFDAILKMGTDEFSKRYRDWLNSKDHKTWFLRSHCTPKSNH